MEHLYQHHRKESSCNCHLRLIRRNLTHAPEAYRNITLVYGGLIWNTYLKGEIYKPERYKIEEEGLQDQDTELTTQVVVKCQDKDQNNTNTPSCRDEKTL